MRACHHFIPGRNPWLSPDSQIVSEYSVKAELARNVPVPQRLYSPTLLPELPVNEELCAVAACPVGSGLIAYFGDLAADQETRMLVVFLANTFAKLVATEPRSVCNYCGKANATSSCSACKRVSYCDRACQRADWDCGHKKLCQLKTKEEKERENEEEEEQYMAGYEMDPGR